ncbi:MULTISPECIES: M24 family metallopeptidase [Rhizobium]|uniref:Xaa-Pro peptidase family protein n=1 Tax=Rhizobium rhododendri TaxID=2506430 RepID=A0ABY8IRL3_9HYPH|nr:MULTISPECIES: Xaa-Pro peptidase family protein [Rhizobium]MBO9171839.1 aminopeptidase P family protein [Rhizobium sp. L245/93]MBO9182720.1 aminopeptidase P family protein [Rhizobium sp. E27B/91]MBZ5762046.1 Xaa-Pro peptidase family protein [Rhizobium sp. VS19-DR96]MBZ5768159.1 Xaa-Pro peptidase family protein [Rhizobium sp. VS19-DR129.2]MBZ5775775.1 Xaa-Pro peptidase family protein [Rhizobium sp. VS19-DRK62.2]
MEWNFPVARIDDPERLQRVGLLQQVLAAADCGGILLGPTESLRYFTGLVWHQSERLLGALVTPSALYYIVPGFELGRVETLARLPGEVVVWQEEESSAALISALLPPNSRLALDDALPLFVYHALAQNLGAERLVDGGRMIRDLRLCKSSAEIDLIQFAMNLTLEVQRRANAFIKPGIRASQVVQYIDEQHRALGVPDGSSFCIVSFAEATSLPHGVDGDQVYHAGDVVLVDTGCRIDGYHSDLTRTYVLEDPDEDFARAWTIEREAQQAVFDAAKIGAACSTLDDAARAVLSRYGLGPDYRLPGLPHRAGHGLGLDIHEEPYLVRGNATVLAPGMCFSNEPMIVFPERFGLRLEDHIYMTETGPRWFTTPAKGPAEPFAN